MADIFLDASTVIELREVGFNSLPSEHNYIIPDYIWENEIPTALQIQVSQWASSSSAGFEIRDVQSRIDFTNPAVASQYGVRIELDASGNFVRFETGSQLGDAVFSYLGGQGELYSSDGIFVLSADSDVIELSLFYDNDASYPPPTLVDFFNAELAAGRISATEYEQIADNLHSFSEAHYPDDWKYRVLPDEAIDSLRASEISDGVATYNGITITPGLLTTAAIGAEALKHAGIAGDVFEISLAITESNALLEAGNSVGAEAVYAQLAGNLIGGAAVGSGAVVVAGMALSGSGVGVVPGALILLSAGVVGSVGGSLAGEQVAGALHTFTVNKLNSGEPLIIDELVLFYHSELKSRDIYEEALLTQALVGIDAGSPEKVRQALLQAVIENPDLAENATAFEAALAHVAVGFHGLINQTDANEIFELVKAVANKSCFGAGTPIDMWPLDVLPKPGTDGIYDQKAVSAKIWKKPIELIEAGDTVVSFDDKGNMVPGHVPRTFQNEVKIVLNFFGTRVTPGHVYYRADSVKDNKFETLIDILRDDGVIQQQNGTLIRASINVRVGDPRDGFVKAFTGTRNADGTLNEKERGRIRIGTCFIVGNSEQRKSWAVADLIEHAGGVVGEDEMIRIGDGPPMAFHWEFGDTLPKPEDYVLEVSGTTLEDIYKAAEWEDQQPQMPAPMVMDGGPVQPLPHASLRVMPRNEPLNVLPGTTTKDPQLLNRK